MNTACPNCWQEQHFQGIPGGSKLKNYSVEWKCFRWENRLVIGWGVWKPRSVITIDYLVVPAPGSYTEQNFFLDKGCSSTPEIKKIMREERKRELYISYSLFQPPHCSHHSWLFFASALFKKYEAVTMFIHQKLREISSFSLPTLTSCWSPCEHTNTRVAGKMKNMQATVSISCNTFIGLNIWTVPLILQLAVPNCTTFPSDRWRNKCPKLHHTANVFPSLPFLESLAIWSVEPFAEPTSPTCLVLTILCNSLLKEIPLITSFPLTFGGQAARNLQSD